MPPISDDVLTLLAQLLGWFRQYHSGRETTLAVVAVLSVVAFRGLRRRWSRMPWWLLLLFPLPFCAALIVPLALLTGAPLGHPLAQQIAHTALAVDVGLVLAGRERVSPA